MPLLFCGSGERKTGKWLGIESLNLMLHNEIKKPKPTPLRKEIFYLASFLFSASIDFHTKVWVFKEVKLLIAFRLKINCNVTIKS